MTWGEIAALIAAGAFLILVIYLAVVLSTLNRTLKIVEKHADPIAMDLEDIADSANDMASDVASKIEMLDPAVKAVSDVGETVSHLTDKVTKKEQQENKLSESIIDLANTALKFGTATAAAKRATAKRTTKKAKKETSKKAKKETSKKG